MEQTEHKDANLRMKRLLNLDRSGLPSDGGPDYNRLVFSASPYLLQHADNPVDWYEWGDEAFTKAAREDKPIFLSIGYATCHWCHVMAHESFENREVAQVFNRHYVCIKVDREERPDIDEQYMAVAQMMTGSGGWPLNIFMTPDKKPFFAMTYIPLTSTHGMPGIIQLLERVAGLWRHERDKLEESSVATLEAMANLFQPKPGPLPDGGMEEAAFRQLTEMYDAFWGGFGNAPKFPMPQYLSFLLRFGGRNGLPSGINMVEHTLRMLRQGGIYDQIGFGFHRYATDRQWLIPHFEKMLYDQALLAMAYLEAFQVTGSSFFRQVANEIFSYVMRDMTSPEGGFYTGQDADTPGGEGYSYLWTPAEIAALLGEAAAPVFGKLFDVTEAGNFEGRNILHLVVPPETFAVTEGLAPEQLTADLQRWRQTVLNARQKRPQPFRDEKVLAGWNGLMIAAFAKGYAVTGTDAYLTAAAAAVAFLEKRLTSGRRLLRSFHLGQGGAPAFLEDYAFFLWGLIELHQATLVPSFLEKARAVALDMLKLFGSEDGGLYETGHDAELLPVRQMSAYDGAVPSGNGVAACNLFRLGRLTDEAGFARAGEGIVRAFMGDAARQPVGFLNMFSAAAFHAGPEMTITLSGERAGLDDFLHTANHRFLPNLVVRYGGEGHEGEYPAAGGRPTAYVCAGGACRPPVMSADALAALLDTVS